MRNDLNMYEQIDRYLNNELTGKELSDFENKLKSDLTFTELVDNQRMINDLVIDQGLLDVKNKIRDLDAADRSTRTSWKLYTGIGAIVILAILGSVKLLQNSETKQILAIKNNTEEKPSKLDDTVSNNKTSIKSIKPTEKKADNEYHSLKDTAVITLEKPTESFNTERLSEKETLINPEVNHHQEITKEKSSETSDCSLKNVVLKITTTESCLDSSTGTIIIDNPSAVSGLAPFSFSIDNENYFRSNVFHNLKGGKYRISIIDANGCTWHDEKEIVVKEKDCTAYEYSFYPDQNEVWKFPLNDNENGKIQIYNRAGVMVYSSEIINGYPDSWNGTADGQPLQMGSYSFVLKIGQDVRHGNITLLR